jgi:flagellar basal body P-ring formation protein FlgA
MRIFSGILSFVALTGKNLSANLGRWFCGEALSFIVRPIQSGGKPRALQDVAGILGVRVACHRFGFGHGLLCGLTFTFLLGGNVFAAEQLGTLELLPHSTASSQGIFLGDVVTNKSGQPLPRIQLAPVPPVGRPMFYSRLQIGAMLTKAAPELSCTNWGGAERIKISRATRVVNDTMLKELLTETLQKESVKDRGDLELRFTRPWNPLVIPDDPVSIKITEMPSSGVSPNFICRFELLAGEEKVGTFQQPLSAKVWKEIYVARSNLTRGQPLRDADIGLERRDVLNNRDYLTAIPLDDPYVEFRENVQAGTQITARVLRLRAIIKRGRMVDAVAQDEALSVSAKAEALEDGVPGQMVRLRNVRSKKEFKGKVKDEQTVVVVF